METLQPIRFSGKQRTAWHYLTDKNTTEIFYGGAAGGGKSYLGCVWHIFNRTTYAGTRGLVGRAKLSALEQSTLVTLFKVAEQMGYQIGRDFNYNSQKHLITWANGSQSILKDLFLYPADPDFISLGSTEYTDAFIDEGTEITQKAFDIVNSRIRWKLNDYDLTPKVLVTCNPSPGWIKDNYLTEPITGNPILLKPYQRFVRALVTDNPDISFVKLYSEQLAKMHSEYDRERLLYGNWDMDRDVSNPFAFQWDQSKHTSMNVEFRRDRRLYISIDFNLNPFCVTFWHYWMDKDGYHLWGIDEAEIQNGSIPAMIQLIKSKYGHALFNVIITGDSMGNNRDIGRVDNSSHYMAIIKGLGLAESQLQVPNNPTHVNSRADVNDLLWQAKQPGSRFEVLLHPDNMRMTCNDMRVVQCDAYGGIIKKDRKDIDQRADYLDTTRSVINLLFKQIMMTYRDV